MNKEMIKKKRKEEIKSIEYFSFKIPHLFSSWARQQFRPKSARPSHQLTIMFMSHTVLHAPKIFRSYILLSFSPYNICVNI